MLCGSKLRATCAVLVVLCGCATAQDAKPAAIRDARHRLGLVATKAIANFRSLESIEANLAAMGIQVSPELLMLRQKIEHDLDATDAALVKQNVKAANDALDRAEALVSRLSRRLGGG